jgi:hypothetical protein
MKGFGAKRAGREALTARGERMRCLHPRYRSVIWIETSEQKLDLLQFAACSVAQPSTGPAEIVRRRIF